jgi:tryptophan synthase beta chain
MMVRDFQAVIGREARRQILRTAGRLPDALVACVGGGSNGIGLFFPFLRDPNVRMIGVEAGGLGISTGRHAARFATGRPGVFQGTKTFVLQDSHGQIQTTHSVSAGLDYSAVGPEHAWYRDLGRIEYASVTDKEALDAFDLLSRTEGLIPALESAHAIAHVATVAPRMSRRKIVLVNLSGRGDKDVQEVAKLRGIEL